MKCILNFAFFFNLYQNLIGANIWLKKYYDNFISDEINKNSENSILDIGCGTGNLIPHLPKNINYCGLDYSHNYISYASKKYPNLKFFQKNVKQPFKLDDKFNIIVCEALISNLNDDEAGVLFNSIIDNCDSTKKCKIIFSDLNYTESGSGVEKFLLKHERGTVIRTKDDYSRLILKYFQIERISEIRDVYRIPYNKIVLECRLK